MYVLSTYLSISTYLRIYEYYSSKELFRYKVIGTQLNQISHNSQYVFELIAAEIASCILTSLTIGKSSVSSL